MRFGNCWIHALWRWCHGGWLLGRGSNAGDKSKKRRPYHHLVHADDLPHDLEVSQFVIDDDDAPSWYVLFTGHVETKLGHVKPPDTGGKIDWVNVSLVVGVFGSIIFTVGYAIKQAITLFV